MFKKIKQTAEKLFNAGSNWAEGKNGAAKVAAATVATLAMAAGIVGLCVAAVGAVYTLLSFGATHVALVNPVVTTPAVMALSAVSLTVSKWADGVLCKLFPTRAEKAALSAALKAPLQAEGNLANVSMRDFSRVAPGQNNENVIADKGPRQNQNNTPSA